MLALLDSTRWFASLSRSAGTYHLCHVLLVNAASPYNGNRGSPAQLHKALQAQWCLGVGLGRRGPYRARTNVIGPAGVGGPYLVDGVGRDAYDLVGTHELACRGQGQVRLSEVYSVGPAGERDVYPVIDDEQYTQLAADC